MISNSQYNANSKDENERLLTDCMLQLENLNK